MTEELPDDVAVEIKNSDGETILKANGPEVEVARDDAERIEDTAGNAEIARFVTLHLRCQRVPDDDDV